MKPAKFYLYRNLNRGGFSLKLRGKVVDYLDTFYMKDVEFRVSKASQNRSRREGQRNVHAYIVADSYTNLNNSDGVSLLGLEEITYNPFHTDTFIVKSTGEPIYKADFIVGINNKVYAQL